MSVAYILNNTYSYVENSKLNPALEVSTSLKAPIHYVSDLSIQKNEDGNMVFDAPVVEAIILKSDALNTDSVFTTALNSLDPELNTITVNSNLDFNDVSSIENLSTLGANKLVTMELDAPTGQHIQMLADSIDFSNSVEGIQNLKKLSVQGSNPIAGQVLGVNEDLDLVWKTDAAGDVSQWATFPAVQDVTIPLYNFLKCSLLTTATPEESQINVVKSVNIEQVLYCPEAELGTATIAETCRIGVEPNKFTGTENFVLLHNNGFNTVYSESNADLLGFSNVQSFRGKFYTTDENDLEKFSVNDQGILKAQSVSAPVLTSTDFKIDVNRELHLNGNRLVVNDLTDYWDGNGSLNAQMAFIKGNIEARDDSNNSVVAIQPSANLLRSDTNADIFGFNEVNCEQLITAYRPTRTLWVAANGQDDGNAGSYEYPFQTIQSAILYAESLYDNTYWYINVLPGTYEGFNVTKKIFIKGCAPSNPDGCSVGCQINSDITIAIDANDGDMFNNVVSISNFLIAGASIEDNSGSTARHVLNISDCYLYHDNGASGRLIHFNPDATDGRLQIFNSRVVNQSVDGTNPMVEASIGMVKLGQTVFQCAGVQNCFAFTGTSRVDSIVQCSFTSTTASDVAPPIVSITSTTTSGFTFAQCAFIYGSSTNKSANANSCGIYSETPGVATTLILTNNSFFLTGTTIANNYAVQDGDAATAHPLVVLYFSNNASPNTASAIRGTPGVTKFSLQAVA
jgi:hypothetical protein